MISKSNLILLVTIVINLKCSCAAENCDKYGILIYEDIKCSPVKEEGKSCPTNFDCNFNRPRSGCLIKGKTHGPGEEISSDLTYSGCSVGCRCLDFNSVQCAVLDCPEWLHSHLDPGCYRRYELGKCCSKGSICNSTETKTCEVDEKTYKIGEKFYPKDTCLSCVCHEDFKGDYDDKTCTQINCNAEIRYSSQLMGKCAPAYFKYQDVKCCPDEFICPDPSDSVTVLNPDADKNSKLDCYFGDRQLKLGEGLRRKVNKYGKDRNLQCECILPPLLTCTEI